MELKLDFDKDKKFQRRFEGFEKQIPFAISRTLNTLAYAGRVDITDAAKKAFTVRTQYTLSGMLVDQARKKSLIATVGTVREYLADHVTGGMHKGTTTSGLVWVPTTTGPMAPRKSDDKVIPRRIRPDRVAAAGKIGGYSFFIHPHSTPGDLKIMYRSGSGTARKRKTYGGVALTGKARPRYPIVLAYTIKRAVRVAADWPIDGIVGRTVARTLDEAVAEAFAYAIATATR